MITQQRLKELLDYNPETGEFIWKVKRKRVEIGDVAGCVDLQGYQAIGIDNKLHRAHRLAWLYVYGQLPNMIDHINGNRRDNKIENLRLVNRSQNQGNRKTSIKNNSGFKGVYWNAKRKKYFANCKNEHIGIFKTAEEAAEAYNKKALELFGEYAKLNLIGANDEENKEANQITETI